MIALFHNQHIRHSYAQTTHAAQGRTSDRVMINADSKATNLTNQKMLYVAISRAKTSASVYTNDPNKLITALKERTGEKQVAMGDMNRGSGATASATAPLAKLKSTGAGLG